MAYSSVAILALLVHLIINYDVLKNSHGKKSKFSNKFYRRFLFGVMAFYISDALWGILYEANIPFAIYALTVIYFAVMAVSVFLWTKFVIEYLNEKNGFTTFISVFGWIYLLFDAVSLLLNFSFPIKFYFDSDGIYHACITRHIALVIQVLMFFISAIYVFTRAIRASGKTKHHHRTVGAFGIAMTLFVISQTFYPLLPLYAIGYLLGTCLVHTFVVEDEKEDYRIELEEHIFKEELQRIEIGSTRLLAYTDPLTGIKNKRAFMEDQLDIEEGLASGRLLEFGIVVFDLNGLKAVNDTKGHEAGDNYIKNSCRLICETFRHSPVYRIGGDEFVAFLEGEDFQNRESIISAFDKRMVENLTKDDVVISCGYDVYKIGENDTFTKIFERADSKMYERKRQLKEMNIPA